MKTTTNTGATDKSFHAVIRECSFGSLAITGYDGCRGFTVLPSDAHHCTTVEQLLARLDEMVRVYGWTVLSVKHRKGNGVGEWTDLRAAVAQ